MKPQNGAAGAKWGKRRPGRCPESCRLGQVRNLSPTITLVA